VSLIQVAFVFFLIANPLGNLPGFVSLLKDFPFQRQRQILLREMFFALCICLFFVFFGDLLLNMLMVRTFTLTIGGGIVLLLTALGMIFSIGKTETDGPQETATLREPFVVPIATPLIAGGGLLTTVMLYSHQLPKAIVTIALLLAWIPVFAIAFAAPYLQKLLGRRGLAATEQLVGMLLLMIACDLISRGLGAFIHSLT